MKHTPSPSCFNGLYTYNKMAFQTSKIQKGKGSFLQGDRQMRPDKNCKQIDGDVLNTNFLVLATLPSSHLWFQQLFGGVYLCVYLFRKIIFLSNQWAERTLERGKIVCAGINLDTNLVTATIRPYTQTYLVGSREGLVRKSELGDSWPVVEDDRDLLVSGLPGKGLFSLTVNSEWKVADAFVSCCLLWRTRWITRLWLSSFLQIYRKVQWMNERTNEWMKLPFSRAVHKRVMAVRRRRSCELK